MQLERISPEAAGISSMQVCKCFEKLDNEWTHMNGVMAARYGKVFMEGWWYPYRPDLVHSNHSLGKSYTATAIGIALTEGKLHLDERMVDLFAEEIRKRGIQVSEKMNRVTLKHVLTMTNGHERHPAFTEDFIRDYFRMAVTDEPGTHFMYNTTGSCMLSAVVHKKTGQHLKEYLTPRLFEKIGIDADRFVWMKYPNGYDAEPGTFTTTEDNLRLALLYMNGGRWNGEQIVSEQFVKDALSVQIDNAYAPEQKDGRCGYGYQLWACSIPGVYRFDGGQGQYGIIWPEKELVIAVHEGAIIPYGAQKTLDVLYENLLNHLQDEPLPENKDAYQKLKELEKSLTIPRDMPNEIKPAVDLCGTYTVTGGNVDPWLGVGPPGGEDFFRIFRDKSADREMREFTIAVGDEACAIKWKQSLEITASMDGSHMVRFVDSVYPGLGYYSATARYLNGYTLEMRIHWLNGWFETVLRFEWQQEQMKVTVMKIRLNEEDNWQVYRGLATRKRTNIRNSNQAE